MCSHWRLILVAVSVGNGIFVGLAVAGDGDNVVVVVTLVTVGLGEGDSRYNRFIACCTCGTASHPATQASTATIRANIATIS